MRKFLLSLAFFAALGASSVYADRNPDRDRIIRRYDESRIYQDSRGEYHWQVIEREVWIPTRRVGTIFGTRTIPGHYEVRQQRVKVYHRNSRNYNPYNQRGNQYNKGKKGHPHGMPPGQRKKYDDRYGDYKNRDNDRRRETYPWETRDNDRRRNDDRWDD